MRLRRTIAALAVGVATTGLAAVTAPAASAAPGPPKQITMKLSDHCDKPSWDANPAFAGVCLLDAGGVTPERFTADLAKGGNNNWWINNRQQTIKAGDSLFVDNVGGETHTFTEVARFGGGIVPPFNVAVPEKTLAQGKDVVLDANGQIPFGVVVGTAVAPDAAHPGPFGSPPSRVRSGLSVGTHRFQCLFHPWMRTVVTVIPNN